MKMSLGMKRSMESIPVSPEQDSVHYPSLYIDGGEATLDKLPESGTMTVTYKRTSKNVSERDGKKHCSCCLEIMSIEEVEGEEPEEDDQTKASKAFDKAAKEVEEEDEE